MSRFGRKADGISERAEGRQMTQSVNCEFLGLDRFGLVSPSYPGLETIRNQTLPRAITDQRVSPQGDSALSAFFGGLPEIAGRTGFEGIQDGQDGRAAGCAHVP